MLILVQTWTPRLDFIFHWLLVERMGCAFELTTDRGVFETATHSKMQYGGTPIPGVLYFASSGLVESTGVHAVTIDEGAGRQLLFFESIGVREHDPLADCFYLLSRYEEYLPFNADAHGRYDPTNSVLFRKNLLQWPLADDLATQIEKRIRGFYPTLPKAVRIFSVTPTIDIDQAYAYRHKTIFRQSISILKTAFTKPGALRGMYQVMTGSRPDPYDSYDFIASLEKDYPFRFIYFFLLGNHSKFDPQVNIHSNRIKALFKNLAGNSLTGIHPSYRSSKNTSLIGEEIELMTSITGKSVSRSRQHYLRFVLPDTYRALTNHGITEDYSMGYASMPGFRAGTCSSFRWYDLSREEHTELRIFPVTIMEGTFIEYLRLNSTMSWTILQRLIDVVRQFNGQFIPIWHNHTLSEAAGYGQWKDLFVRMLKYVQHPENQ